MAEQEHKTDNRYWAAFDAWKATCSCGETTGNLPGTAAGRSEASRWAVNHRLAAKGLVA